MAKDRFSNQKKNNYQNSFIDYNRPVKKSLVFTKQQRLLIRTILEKSNKVLSEWERNILINLNNSATYSAKQKDVLNTIYKKTKRYLEV